MHACGEPGACRVVRSAFTRRWRAGGYWRLAVVAVVAAPADVSGSRHAVLPVGVPVCADTRTPHTACARVPMYGVRDAHGVGDGARSSEREMTAETQPGALTHGSRFLGVCAKDCSRGMHAGDHGNACYQDPSFMLIPKKAPCRVHGRVGPPPRRGFPARRAAGAPSLSLQHHRNIMNQYGQIWSRAAKRRCGTGAACC